MIKTKEKRKRKEKAKGPNGDSPYYNYRLDGS